MRINTNIAALNTFNQYTVNNSAANKSIEKLSSGSRINSASDDAAGLAISEKMRSQIRGLDQASRNSQDGISMVQTAEGALEETEEILQRMRELSVQASNDTYTSDDKVAIQSEIDQLVQEIDRISTDTEFNNKTLLDGTLETNANVASTDNDITSASVADNDIDSGTYYVEVGSTTINSTIDNDGTGATSINVTGTDTEMGTYTIELEEVDAANSLYNITMTDSNGDEVASLAGEDLSADGTYTINGVEVTFAAADVSEGKMDLTVSADASFTVYSDDAGTTILDVVTIDDNTTGSVEVNGLELNFDSGLTDSGTAGDPETQITVDNNSVSLQIGANSGQKIDVAISEMSASALNMDTIDVTTEAGAESAIDAIDTAINAVSSERASLGAVQNRLDHTINNLTTSAENLTASESRIRDVDIAKEMMEYTTKNVLQQSAQSMLSQANSQPESVLQLLR